MVEVGLQEIICRALWPNFKGEQMPDSAAAPPEIVGFQGIRVGYFCLDRDSTDDTVVLNRIDSEGGSEEIMDNSAVFVLLSSSM